ncbi:thioesterase superfamily protein, partial [gut metagenome]
MSELTIGMKGSAQVEVVHENTAAAVGSGALEVFATPSMIALMEKVALELVAPCLEEGQGTVGIEL